MNKITRKSLSLILCMLLVLSSVSTVFASSVQKTDYDSHWAKTMIQSAVESGIVKGYPDGSFKPENSITRAEFFTIVNNAFDFEEMSDKKINDVPTKEWYAVEVAKALEAGYVTSYLNGNIEPTREITREEAAVIISNVKNLKSKSTLNPFTDSEMSADWSTEKIISVFEAKIMTGYPDGSFKPQSIITRAEAVVTLTKALAYKAAIDYTYDKATVYGSDEQTTVDGNIIITKSGAILKNVVVTGDLTISKEVAEGDVTLNGVVVKGSTFVYGGGGNSIHLINTTMEKLYVDKEKNSVRIVASGSTNVGDVVIRSSVRLEENSLSKNGFDKLIVEEKNAKKVLISLIGTKCSNVDIKGEFVTLNMTSTSKISKLDIEGKNTKIIGKGVITQANVKSDGVSFEKKPTKVSLGEGVKDPKVTSTSTSSSSSSGGSRGGSSSGSSSSGGRTPSVSVTSVSLSSSMGELEAGDNGTIIASISPSNASNTSVTWSSDDESVATVASNGKVTAHGAGTAKITATASGETDTLNVEVSSTANVATAAEFTAALNGQGVKTITLTSDISGSVTATRLVDSANMTVDFGAYSLNGNLNITANSLDNITFTGDAGDRITGNITIAAMLATVTNNVAISGSATLNGVGFASYKANGTHGGGINMHGQGRLNLSDDASAAVVHITTSEHVVLAGTIDKIEIEVENVVATIEGTITDVVVDAGAESARVELTSTSHVANVIANSVMVLSSEAGADKPKKTGTKADKIKVKTLFKVKFDNNGGDVDAKPNYKLVDEGVAIGTLPKEPQKTNYIFDGWNTEVDGSGDVVTDTTVVNSAITVYAKWKVVQVVEVTGVTLDNATLRLTAGGKTGTLVKTVAPTNATNKTVTWSSSDESVATVIDGVVTPLTRGTSTITVTTVDGSFTGTSEVRVLSGEKVITSINTPHSATLTDGNLTGVTYFIHVNELKSILKVSPYASVEILDRKGGQALVDQSVSLDGSMIIRVTAEDGTIAEYTIEMLANNPVTFLEVEGGTATVGTNSPANPEVGETVTVNITDIEAGKEIKLITVKNSSNELLIITEETQGSAYSFLMPDSTIVVRVVVGTISVSDYTYTVESSFGSESMVPSVLTSFKLYDSSDVLVESFSLYRNDELISTDKNNDGEVVAPNMYFSNETLLKVKLDDKFINISKK